MQKKMIVLRAHFYRLEKLLNTAIVFFFVIVSFSVTPILPTRERRTAHWITTADRRKK